MKHCRILLLLVATALVVGCGSSLQTTIPQDWSEEVGEVDVAMPAPDGSALVLHKPSGFMKQGGTVVVDGTTGDPLAKKSSNVLDLLKDGIYIGDMSVAAIDSKNLDFRYLDGMDLMLVLRSSTSSHEVHCIDLSTGKELWQSENFLWTLENFKALGSEAAGKVMGLLGAQAGGAAATVSAELTRSRQLSRLIIPVPELNAFLFKTLDALVLIQAQTGKILWANEDVSGSGFSQVKYLPDSKDFLLMTMSTGLVDAVTNAKRLYRVDAATGDIRWDNLYVGRDDQARGIQMYGSSVLLDYQGGFGEVFRFDTGKKLLQTKDMQEAKLGNMFKNSLVNGQFTAAPEVDGNMIYAVQTSNLKGVGYPDWIIQKYNLDTGKLVWESEPVKSMADIRDLRVVDGVLLARATGMETPYTTDAATFGLSDRKLIALDPESGKILWKQVMGEGRKITNLLVSGNSVYIGDAETLNEIDLHSGEIVNSVDFSATKAGKLLYLRQNNGNIVAVGDHGIVYFSSSELQQQTMLSIPARIGSAELINGELLAYMGHEGVAIIDLSGKSIVGYIVFPKDSGNNSQNPTLLNSGYFVGENGNVVYTLEKKHWILTRYKI